jgi:hypothetical protein
VCHDTAEQENDRRSSHTRAAHRAGRQNVRQSQGTRAHLSSANKAQAVATKVTTLKKSGAPRLDLTSDGDGKAMLMKMITDSVNEHVTKTIVKNTVYKNDGKDVDGTNAATKTEV